MLHIPASNYYGNIVPLQQAISEQGINAALFLEKAGIDPAYSQNNLQRISHEKMSKFIEIVVNRTSPNITLSACEYLNPACFHAFGSGLLFSADIRSFCLRFESYFKLISTSINVHFVEEEEVSYLTFSEAVNCSDIVSNYFSDAFAALTVKFLRLIVSPKYTPKNVSLTWSPSSEIIHHYHDYFNCNIELSAKETAVYFEKESLDKPLFGANFDLALTSDKLVTELLEKTASADLKSRVFTKLIEFLPTGDCSRETIAKSLSMSVSCFHSKLKQEGTSYQQLVDSLRKELAIKYIINDNLSRETAAELLGFSDCSNFSRAFKRWVGVSPNDYKNIKLN